ncbi:MAG: ferritin-like domain-containing protein [Comamonadaceae bacterium]|nr:MAG: ferritin-like domain-containing protein [Comamonadaceae bacterium]
MQPTTTGTNRSGAAVSPQGVEAMIDATQRYSPPMPIDTSALEEERAYFTSSAERIGSIPPPATLKGVVTAGLSKLVGDRPELLMDKIGERIAFERTGTRLYDALIVKCRVAMAAGAELPALGAEPALGSDMESVNEPARLPSGESALITLERIREDELSHFHLLCDAMRRLGGDPTAQTPCADVVGTASMGLLQVITDPRTTLAQALNTLLTVELTDNAGWELLIGLAESEGQSELAAAFSEALAQEAEHLRIVRQWLTALLAGEKTSAAI